MFMKRNRIRHRHGNEPLAVDTSPAMLGGCPACSDFQPLSAVGKGCRCRIRRHRARGAVRQRLMDMGFVPNAEVEVIRVATLGDPMEIRVGDSFVTLRKREAEQIETTAA
ncbi:FeoA family protein [Oceanidesulfovibrio indonesiensis]|nr:FeoA family protein [Oceanidesulfovibrio indonesiensis]